LEKKQIMHYAQEKQMAAYSNAGLGALGGGLVHAQDAGRQPEVTREMESLAKACEVLGITAERLTDRLSPIRRNVGAMASTGTDRAPEPVMCGMASVLRERRQQIERYTNELANTLDQLEI
jgi:hypothetical protein